MAAIQKRNMEHHVSGPVGRIRYLACAASHLRSSPFLAEAAHEKQVAQAWATAVAERQADLARFTRAIEVAVEPLGITSADLAKTIGDRGETSACKLDYKLGGLRQDRFAALPDRLEAALKAAGWRPQSNAAPNSVDGATLDQGNWQAMIEATRRRIR